MWRCLGGLDVGLREGIWGVMRRLYGSGRGGWRGLRWFCISWRDPGRGRGEEGEGVEDVDAEVDGEVDRDDELEGRGRS